MTKFWIYAPNPAEIHKHKDSYDVSQQNVAH